MSYDIFTCELNKIKICNKNKQVINTINPHSYVTAKKDKVFEEALRKSDILLPDGMGIVMAAKHISWKRIKKVAGMDVHIHLLELLNAQHGKCFYMGSSSETLSKIKERLFSEYPNVDAEFYSPPYKEHFSDDDNMKIVDEINGYKPDVLFIGMTAPKQEKWLHNHKDIIDADVICSIGAVFDFFAGTVKRPLQLWINLHSEWLPRLLKEPKRLWKRNFVSTPLFLLDMTLYQLRIKK